ncbi:MAG: ATP-binding protein [Elusimicrobiota bacterium]|jgi:hypothetical protein|nr:ATP-binding protein [Elusimicrobiota bacterium]
MQKLPIGIQSFQDLRTNDYLYVDKTQFIHELATTGRIYFLSRPRKFGKSLLVNTMEELFKGNKELFKGLFIYDKWNWDIKYPVLKLDFGKLNYGSSDDLSDALTELMFAKAKEWDIVLDSSELHGRFGELLRKIEKKAGQSVVLLMDEYDKPIVNYLSNPKKAKENTITLDRFSQVIKASDNHLHFIFLTGMNKFAVPSAFSSFNSPNDITTADDCAAICGYTQEELETTFSQYIDDSAKKLEQSRSELLENMKSWYGGYTWDGWGGKIKVYNPFSALTFFDKQEFSNYWKKTSGSIPAKILLKDYSLLEDLFKQTAVSEMTFNGIEAEDISETSFMFQAGYLTITDVQRINMRHRYFLGIPNQEVRETLTGYMLSAYTKIDGKNLDKIADTMRKQINNSDAKGLEKSLKALYDKIPADLYKKDVFYSFASEDALYYLVFLAIMSFLGFQFQGEIKKDTGKIDCVLTREKLNIVTEIKYERKKSKKALLDEAIEQINDKKYYEAYLNKPAVLLAVSFSAGKNKKRLTEIGCRFEKV